MPNMRYTLLLAAASCGLSGCNTVQRAWGDRAGYYTQNLPDLRDDDAREFARRQNNLWNCFVSMAQAKVDEFEEPVREKGGYECKNVGALPNVVKSTKSATVAEIAVPQADPKAAPPKTETNIGNESTQTEAETELAEQEQTQQQSDDFPANRQTTTVSRIAITDGSGNDMPAYSEVVAAGLLYVDVRCDRFMDALFWFNRMRETASRQIQYVGAASAAALTLLKASEEVIGLTPLGIGLFDQTVNNIGRGLLYELPPQAVRQLVERQQQAYLDGVAKEYTSRPHAMQTIQGYASLCLPATIETEVNRAIAAAEYKPIEWENPKYDWSKGKDQQATTGEGKKEEGTTREGTPPPNNLPAIEPKAGDGGE